MDIVRREVETYAGIALHASLYPVFDEVRHVYAVMCVDNRPVTSPARAVVMARIVDDRLIIETDTTDKPLIEALQQAGIPRTQIVAAYQGVIYAMVLEDAKLS